MQRSIRKGRKITANILEHEEYFHRDITNGGVELVIEVVSKVVTYCSCENPGDLGSSPRGHTDLGRHHRNLPRGVDSETSESVESVGGFPRSRGFGNLYVDMNTLERRRREREQALLEPIAILRNYSSSSNDIN